VQPHRGFLRVADVTGVLDFRRSVGGLNILTLVELELRDVDGEDALVGLKLFSRMTLSGRTNEPCFALHLKYRCPLTLPSCFPGMGGI